MNSNPQSAAKAPVGIDGRQHGHWLGTNQLMDALREAGEAGRVHVIVQTRGDAGVQSPVR